MADEAKPDRPYGGRDALMGIACFTDAES